VHDLRGIASRERRTHPVGGVGESVEMHRRGHDRARGDPQHGCGERRHHERRRPRRGRHERTDHGTDHREQHEAASKVATRNVGAPAERDRREERHGGHRRTEPVTHD
jgi:hypothetical protein